MARLMWGNDNKHVYRVVVHITYPENWSSLYDLAVPGSTETTVHGPYLEVGPARAAVTRVGRELHRRWLTQLRRNPALESPVVEHEFQSSPLKWAAISG